MKKLLTEKDRKILEKVAEEKAFNEARKKELEIIYPSLVGLAEGQNEITIEVPNGVWKFTKEPRWPVELK